MQTSEPALSALAAIVGLTSAAGIASALVASLFVSLPERARRAVVPPLVSFATGALLGAALIGLLPEAVAGAGIENVDRVGLALLAGLLFFFLLEKFVLWHHCHDDVECGTHELGAHAPDRAHERDPAPAHAHGHGHGAGLVSEAQRQRVTGPMILWGDAFHNVLDGVVIAAAYLTSPALGLATAIAVFTHELPTEIGDIGILLHSGMSRARALLLNLLVSLSAVLGGIAAYFLLGRLLPYLPYALAFAAASMLYIAAADLIPGLHRQTHARATLQQVVLILLGVAAIWLTQPPGHGH